MAEVFEKDWNHFTFRRTQQEGTLIQWNEIKSACFYISLDENKDSITWPFSNDGKFTMKSFYNQLIMNELYYPSKFSWKVKTPPTVKLFYGSL